MTKTLFIKIFLASFLFIFFLSSVLLFGDQNGRTGRTLKTSTSGCGGCHGSTATTDVSVTISGPDSVNTGQQVQYTLTISKPSKTGMGLDIATRLGTLAPVSGNIHLSNGELTHNNNISMTNGTGTVTFRYTAPGTTGTDTLWATGNATNSDGNTSGDDWNWAVSKRIIVRSPIGIEPVSTAYDFKLSQNYPNPFNPSTTISLSLRSPGSVVLKVYDALGNELETLLNKKMNEGDYEIEWNAAAYPSGVYYYRLNANDLTETKKMVLIK